MHGALFDSLRVAANIHIVKHFFWHNRSTRILLCPENILRHAFSLGWEGKIKTILQHLFLQKQYIHRSQIIGIRHTIKYPKII